MNKLIFVLILMSISCNQTNDISLDKAELVEIDELKTHSHKSEFLTALFRVDQEIRNNEHENNIITKFGYKSKEHKEVRKANSIKDRKNYLKLKTYLKKYGYPELEFNYDKVGVNGIPYIIGHTGNVSEMKEVFPIIHNAYKNKKCPIDDVVWVLSEMYESKHGELYDMKTNRFTVEQEYKELMIANRITNK